MKETTSASAATTLGGSALGPSQGDKGRATHLTEEAFVGRRVRVREDHRTVGLRGREGTIAARWGDLSYPAFDVVLDEGDWLLFWYHELEVADET